MKRRTFIKNTAWGSASLSAVTLAACNNAAKMDSTKPELKISLAQSSLHKAIQAGEIDAMDFASIAVNDSELLYVQQRLSTFR